MKILFLLRKNSDYYSFPSQTENGTKAGLFNSATMTKDQLVKHLGITADLKILEDANTIDREVTLFKPEFCILEALWVTPEKLAEVAALHPKITFVIRIHSEVPFLANEAIAIDWIKRYFTIPNAVVAFNSKNAYNDFLLVFNTIPAYLPNIYEDILINYPSVQERIKYVAGNAKFTKANNSNFPKKEIHVGCFGALRPMKNQLFQAFTAVEMGNLLRKKIFFHINASRTEHGGQPVLTNLRALFEKSPHELVEHSWLNREDFLNLVTQMDVGMQISFNESFNIVTADFVAKEVPVIVSDTIDWMPRVTKASPTDSIDALGTLLLALHRPNRFAYQSQVYLNRYNILSINVWQDYLNKIHLV